MTKNYYIILGIDKNASASDIKDAYRKKVQKYHPDHYGPDSSNFILIQEAYDVLGDSKRRKNYDKTLSSQHKNNTSKTHYSRDIHLKNIEPLIPVNKKRVEEISLTKSFDELYDHLDRNFSYKYQSKGTGIKNLKVEIPISSKQARTGGQIEIMIPVKSYCSRCYGTGMIGFWECVYCNGYGVVEQDLPLLFSFPGGIQNQYNKSISLNQYGIYNFFLTIRLIVSQNKSF